MGRKVELVAKTAGALLLVLIAMAAANLWWVTRAETGAPPQPANARMVATPLGRVSVNGWGRADAPVVLVVPGTAAWGGFWRDAAADLAGHGRRVLVVDLPPFGWSEPDPAGRYDRAAQAARLAAVLAALSPGRPATVVGHSFGAGAATELALAHPTQVRRLVLVDAALGRLDDASDPPPARLLRLRPLARAVTAASLTNPRMLRPLLASFLYRKAAADPWIATLRAPMTRPGTTAAYAAWLPQLFARGDGAASRTSAALARIRVPVAIVWGAEDGVTPLDQGRRLRGLMRADRFAVLPDVGHIPHIEDRVAFGTALARATGD